MASVGPNVASSPEYAGTLQSIQLLVVRGIVDTETSYLSNIRALPTPEDSASTYGTKGNLQYPPAILVHHVSGDITTYFSDLQPKFHPSFNSVAAAALIGVSQPLLSVLRGLDMDRPGKLHASIMTSDRLGATPGFRVGTSDHLETFGNQGFPGFTNLKDFSLGEDTGRDLWLDAVLPQFEAPQLKTVSECPRVIEAFSACLTGMVPGGHFGPLVAIPGIISGWDMWGFDAESTHKLSWLFPTPIPDSMKMPHPNLALLDFSKMKEWDIAFMLAVWDPILEMVTHPLAADVLNKLSANFAPMVQDLVRWGAMSHPSGSSKTHVYSRVWRSTSMAEKDRFFLRGRPLPIDEAASNTIMGGNAEDLPGDEA